MAKIKIMYTIHRTLGSKDCKRAVAVSEARYPAVAYSPRLKLNQFKVSRRRLRVALKGKRTKWLSITRTYRHHA